MVREARFSCRSHLDSGDGGPPGRLGGPSDASSPASTRSPEFIRDILALATTKSSGERFLIVGFDDKTHQLIQSVDPAIDQDRLEHILNRYADPAPQIRRLGHSIITSGE